MAYPGLGAGVPISQFFRRSPGVAQMTPGFIVPAAPQSGARTGPSNEDVLRRVFGSVAKGQAAQAASIAEARQRESEQTARVPRGAQAPPEPPMLAPHDIVQRAPASSPIEAVEYEDEESDGEVIEEIAEGEEEGDSEFSGWGIGMGERPVGVTNTLREVARMDHVRRRQRSMKRGGLAKMTGRIAAQVLQKKPRMGVLKPRKKMIRIPKPGVNIWRT
jgi:hypothetical protein